VKVIVPSNGDALPLWHRIAGTAPQPAFLELDINACSAKFDWQKDSVVRSSPDKFCETLRWDMPENVTASRLAELADELLPFLETIVTRAQYSVEQKKHLLDEECEEASDRIASVLADLNVAEGDLAAIWPADEYVREVVSTDIEITGDTADEFLEEMATEYCCIAERDGDYIDGSLRDAAFAMRASQRRPQ